MMLNRVINIMEANLTDARRIGVRQARKHPLFLVYFVIILIAGIYMGVFIGIFIYGLTREGMDFYFEHGVLATVFTLVVMGRAGSSTYSGLLRRKELVWWLSSSEPGEVMVAFFLEALIGTYLLVATAVLMFLLAMNSVGVVFFLPLPWVIEGSLLLINGTIISVYTPVIMNIQERNTRWKHIAGVGVINGAFFSLLRYWTEYTGLPVTASSYYAFLTLSAAVNLIVLWHSRRFLEEAWAAQTAKSGGLLVLGRKNGWSDHGKAAAIYIKELRQFLRERDSVATSAISLFLAGALIYVYRTEDFSYVLGGSVPKAGYAVMVGVTLYLALEMQPLLIGLESTGMEGKKMWVYRSTPTKGRDILWGKFLALATISAPLTLAITIPVPVMVGMSSYFILFISLLGIVSALFYGAVGVYLGSRFPNMADSSHGSPDIITELGVAFLGLFMAVPILLLPGLSYYILGPPAILVVLDMLGWSIVTAFILCIRGGRNLDRMESDTYL